MNTTNNDLFEVIYNCRAMRRLKTDPVPDNLIYKLIDAGNRAPSGSNQQGARWIAVKDAEQKAKLAALNKEAVTLYASASSSRPTTLPHHDVDKRERMLGAVLWQAEHMHEIPVLLIACYRFGVPITNVNAAAAASGSIWPGIQNVLLAARGLGLGAAPTTLGLTKPAETKEILALPDDMIAACLIPIGYPIGKFGPVTRLPVEETMCWDRWQEGVS